MHILKRLLAVLLVALSALQLSAAVANAASLAIDNSAAVILAYHRIDEDAFPGNSLRLENFQSHLQEIKHGDYTVMPLPDIIKAMKSGITLPPRTIAITFEGGYQSAYQNAIPLLLKEKIPFTVFYAGQNAHVDTGQYMGWNDLKSLARYDFVSLGLLPDLYTHFNEDSAAGLKRHVNNARLEYRKIFGEEPELFSYPFGEFDTDFKNWIEKQGFIAAFGIQSGVSHPKMDYFNVPRFTMTEGFSDIERFRMITGALPIPAYDIEPDGHFIPAVNPIFGFSVPEEASFILNSLQCFISGYGEAELIKLGNNRVEIRPHSEMQDDKIRINCTANTGTNDTPTLRWFGMMYTLEWPITKALGNNSAESHQIFSR